MASTNDPTTIYCQITIKGRLDSDWGDYFSGLTISTQQSAAQTRTTLSGELTDQAALMGVLNNLYGLGFVILFVESKSKHDMEVKDV